MSNLVSEDLGAGFEPGIKGMRLLLGISVLTGTRLCRTVSFDDLELSEGTEVARGGSDGKWSKEGTDT